MSRKNRDVSENLDNTAEEDARELRMGSEEENMYLNEG